VIVAEVREQGEDSATLLLEIRLDGPELITEGLVLHVFLLHFLKQSA
jgi:hypothetical protein